MLKRFDTRACVIIGRPTQFLMRESKDPVLCSNSLPSSTSPGTTKHHATFHTVTAFSALQSSANNHPIRHKLATNIPPHTLHRPPPTDRRLSAALAPPFRSNTTSALCLVFDEAKSYVLPGT